jgi:exopolysaccharide biosynthesis protein
MLSKMSLTLCLVALGLLPTGLSSAYYNIQPGEQSTASAAQSSQGQWAIRSNAPGVVWMSKKYVNSSYGNQVINVLNVDPTLAKLRSVRTQYNNKYESILSMGKRTKALAGVNGGFFCYTTDDVCGSTACSSAPNCPKPVQPRSLLIIAGTTKSTNCALRTSLGLTGTGTPKIQQLGAGQSWPGVSYAIGAGPNLVTNSLKNITQEGFCWYTESAPRTAVATTSGGHILLVTVKVFG